MRIKLLSILFLAVGCLAARQASASIAYAPPPGGWTYEFNGDQLNTTNGTAVAWSGETLPVSLDGTWIFGGGSDSFDGSTNGGTFAAGGYGVGNKPGGWTMYTGTLPSDNGVTFIRMQDTGDPRQTGLYGDPSNRKLEMARSMTLLDGASSQQLQDGFTLCFRARVPTTAKASGIIDPLFPASAAIGGPGPIPYPAGGDGYVTFNGGKGNIFIHDQSAPPYGDASYGASIAFSLTQTNDNAGTAAVAGFAGLTMNELNGNTANNSVNFGQGSSTNKVTLDPTDWHEFWIVIKADPSGLGTHQVYIYVDGAVTPSTFHLTAGASEGSVDPGNSGFRGATFIAIASPSTGQSCALDVDFLDYKLGEFYPAGAANPPTVGLNAPAFRQPFYSGTLHVEAIPAGSATIPDSGARLTLNGVDVSASLTPSGTSTDKTFTYSSLVANTVYKGQMVISDSNARAVTNIFFFDTFVEGGVTLIESEDYNYNSGQSINNPAAGDYDGKAGTYKVDFLDASLHTVGASRTADAVDTEVTPDFARPRFTLSGKTDYDINAISRGEWCNYTRTIAAGSYSAVLRAASAVAQDVRLDLVTSSPTVPNQTVKFLGSFHVPDTGGANNFADVTLADVLGNALPLELSGATTLRLTAVSANNDLALNYLVLNPTTAPAAPVVTTAPAAKETGVLPNAAVEAAIYDGSTPVDPTSVGLMVNGGAVSPLSVVKSGSITLVKYTPPALWPVLSSNNVTLTFTNGTGHSVNWGFTVAFLPTLTPALRVSDATTPGFVFRVFDNGNEDAPSTARAEEQLAGLSTYTNLADPFQQGPADLPGVQGANPDHDPVTFQVPTVIDMSQGNALYGNFVNPLSLTDDGMPGVVTSVNKDGLAAEIKTFISLPAGVNTMVVNSDDGFKVQAGALTTYPILLADVEGLFGVADMVFRFIVQQAGVYPFRMVWYQSDHGFAVEWAVVNADGTHALVNDTANALQTGPASFSTGTVPIITRPTLTITRAGAGQVTLTWGAVGTLQIANSPAGPYQDVPGAVSPYLTAPGGIKYYRVRVYP